MFQPYFHTKTFWGSSSLYVRFFILGIARGALVLLRPTHSGSGSYLRNSGSPKSLKNRANSADIAALAAKLFTGVTQSVIG